MADFNPWIRNSFEMDEFYKNVIKKKLPFASPAKGEIYGNPDEAPKYFRGLLSSESLFKNTDYEFTGANDFLHFTSLPSLSNILNSGHLKMSEFKSLSDHHELSFGWQVFDGETQFASNDFSLEDFKRNIFCLSMTEGKEENLINPYLWEAYGDKSRGACIRFRINDQNPLGFSIGKILYGAENLKILEELRDIALKYKNNKERMFPNNFGEMIGPLFAFHKGNRFKPEDEVRLILVTEREKYNNHDLFTIHTEISKDYSVRYFNKVYIKGRHELLEKYKNVKDYPIDKLFKYFPQIEITDIYLGSGFSTIEGLMDYNNFLIGIRERFNYEYKIHMINIENRISQIST